MVSIRKFWITVLVSNRIEYWSNYSIWFEILNIHTALLRIEQGLSSTSKASSSSSTLGELRIPVRAVPRGSNGSTTTCSVPLISVRQKGQPCPSESFDAYTLTHVPYIHTFRVLFLIDFFVYTYVSFFLSLSARLRENGWTDLNEIFRVGVEWPWDSLIQFWINSKQPRDDAMLKLIFVLRLFCAAI